MYIPHIWLERYSMALAVSFTVSCALTFVSIRVLKKLKIMDEPDPRKIHKKPIPRMGGIAIYVGFLIPMFLKMDISGPQEGIMIGSAIALMIGVFDDIWHVPATFKLISLFLLTLLIWRFGIVTDFPLAPEKYRDTVNIVITMLWLTGLCSAINAIDHMDGLAAGLSAIASFSYLAVSLQSGQWIWGLMSISMIGSLLGFLVFNWHPAKIFMGDSGSFFLGFSLGAIGIMGGWSRNPIKSAIIPFAVLSIPIMDLLYVIVTRRLTGITKSLKESITYCGKDHIGHRFCRFGFTQVKSVRIIYLVSMTISISALLIRYTGELESFLLLFQILMVYIIIFILMRHPEQHNGI